MKSILSFFLPALFADFFLLKFGGGGGSSSSSNTTNNFDKRIALESGAAISGDGSSINISSTTTDAGIVSRALDSIDASNATLGQGFTKLLDTSGANYDRLVGSQSAGFSQLLSAADKIFSKGEQLIGQTQQSVADAYRSASSDKGGTIDNKTIIVLAVAGAVTVFAMRAKK